MREDERLEFVSLQIRNEPRFAEVVGPSRFDTIDLGSTAAGSS